MDDAIKLAKKKEEYYSMFNNTSTKIVQPLNNNDPLPQPFKDNYFKGKTPPNLIEDYDCIGIDAENTLI
jgi:hypothetical protein